MRRWIAVAAGVLVLTGGCVARSGEPPAASQTTTTSRDVERFNARICPGSHGIKPVTVTDDEITCEPNQRCLCGR